LRVRGTALRVEHGAPSVTGMTHTHAHTSQHDEDADGLAEILDLDAEVLAEHLASVTAGLPVTADPRRVVDLGSGTGTGTFALLERFPGAEVTAVDASAHHLHRLRRRAEAAGWAHRVRTVEADLDGDWPDLGQFDLAWASASLHHLAEPDRALRAVHGLLAPGGLLAVLELAGFPRFLPDDAPEERPGLEGRVHAALALHHAEHLPHRDADWGARLAAAGFTVESGRTLAVEVEGTRSEAVGRYALASLRRLRGSLAGVLDADDVRALDQLLDPTSRHSLLHRHDLAVRTERTVWAARRA
jgi:SAM-dependent methyltransferase